MDEPVEHSLRLRPVFLLWFLAVLGWLVIIAGGVLWWGLPRWEPDLVVEESPWLGPAFEAVLHGGAKQKFLDRLPDWGERVVPTMCNIAASRDDLKRRLLALEVLHSKTDPSAVPTLLALLHDPDEEILEAVLYALWGQKDPAIVQPVLDLLVRASPKVAVKAAGLLADRPQPVSFDVVSTTLLSSSRTDLQARGCMVLRGATDPRAIPALVERLGRFRDPGGDVAGYSLGQLQLPGVTEAISAALSDPDPRHRYGAVVAAHWRHWKTDRSALLQPLLRLITDPESDIRHLVLSALRRFPDDAAVAALRSAIEAGGPFAVTAIESLSRNTSTTALPIVLTFIDHPDAKVRKKLLWSLRITDLPEGFDHRLILALLHHQDAEVVAAARFLAGQLKLTPDEQREYDAVP